ncbi:MAG: hypothetical protein ACJA13_002915 [Paraglaciecola sp.]|jgi:hypothetical protein
MGETMFLTRLIYVSTIYENAAQETLEDILKVSRDNNTKNNLTGMLCFNRKYFLQCLEGSRTNVNETYNRILKDNRHGNIIILDYSEINARDFADWSMAYAPSSSMTATINLMFSGSKEFNPYDLPSNSAYLMMLELKKILSSV